MSRLSTRFCRKTSFCVGSVSAPRTGEAEATRAGEAVSLAWRALVPSAFASTRSTICRASLA